MQQTACPKCGSKAYKRNGYTRHAKQNHRCLDCGRQFSIEAGEMPKCIDQQQFIERHTLKILAQ